MSHALSNKVLTGPFAGMTKAQLKPLLAAAQAEMAAGGATITSTTINGQSLTRAGGPSVIQRIRLLRAALAQVDPDFLAPTSQIAVRFGPEREHFLGDY